MRRLLRIENEAGVVPPQHSHDAQTQAGGVAAYQAGRLQQQLGFHQTQLRQKLRKETTHTSQWTAMNKNIRDAFMSSGAADDVVPYMKSKVYEATNVEGVLHEVKD